MDTDVHRKRGTAAIGLERVVGRTMRAGLVTMTDGVIDGDCQESRHVCPPADDLGLLVAIENDLETKPLPAAWLDDGRHLVEVAKSNRTTGR